ncbi:hypothetical protein [Nocardia takedensis]|uniref:hypothetical protein n=1 Tax=Nocardia takedensis TaxID=259390 RepID=UPI0002D4796A|nr:hypothetical protein [Nocardia takedensis]
MSIPNPVDPDDHGEELNGPTPARDRAREQEILDAFTAELADTPAAELARQLVVPVNQDGGALGEAVAPVVDRVSKVRDIARIWGPALAGTAAAGTAVALLPLPGPVALYVLALAAYGWWHCAGRPGAVETVRMLAYAAGDALSWVRHHVEALATRRARYETRRTAVPKPDPETGANR